MSYTPHTSPRDGIRTMQFMVFPPLVCGIARTLFYPMDVLRDAVTSPRADAAQRLRIRMRSGGALALWRGNSVRLPRFILLRSLTFCSFDVLRRRMDASLSAMSPTANTVVPIRIGKVMAPFVAAGLGATVASLAQYPMDHVQALNSARPKGRKFQSVGQGLRHIVHLLGLKGLWKWFPSVSLPYIMHSSLSFGTFYSIQPGLPWRANFGSDFILGTLSSLVASMVLFPVERRCVLNGMPPIYMLDQVMWGSHNQGSILGAARRGGTLTDPIPVGPLGRKMLRGLLVSQVVRTGLIFALLELAIRSENGRV